jgi:amidohydrolase
MPHHAKDPVSVAAQIVNDLQTMVTRKFDIFDPVVVTVGRLQAGTARNIIPDTADFEATVRAFSTDAMSRAGTEIARLCEGIAAAYDVTVDCDFRIQYPPTVNHLDHAEFVAATVTDVFGADRYEPMAVPRAGSEDFSQVIAEVPGCYVFLGARSLQDGPVRV